LTARFAVDPRQAGAAAAAEAKKKRSKTRHAHAETAAAAARTLCYSLSSRVNFCISRLPLTAGPSYFVTVALTVLLLPLSVCVRVSAAAPDLLPPAPTPVDSVLTDERRAAARAHREYVDDAAAARTIEDLFEGGGGGGKRKTKRSKGEKEKVRKGPALLGWFVLLIRSLAIISALLLTFLLCP
jgi:hypothetical protein